MQHQVLFQYRYANSHLCSSSYMGGWVHMSFCQEVIRIPHYKNIQLSDQLWCIRYYIHHCSFCHKDVLSCRFCCQFQVGIPVDICKCNLDPPPPLRSSGICENNLPFPLCRKGELQQDHMVVIRRGVPRPTVAEMGRKIC